MNKKKSEKSQSVDYGDSGINYYGFVSLENHIVVTQRPCIFLQICKFSFYCFKHYDIS